MTGMAERHYFPIPAEAGVNRNHKKRANMSGLFYAQALSGEMSEGREGGEITFVSSV